MYTRSLIITLTSLVLLGCPQVKPEHDAAILLDGYVGKDGKHLNVRDIALTDDVLEKLARDYQTAFDEKTTDAIVTRLRQELIVEVDQKEPRIAFLRVRSPNKAFAIAILTAWIKILVQNANEAGNGNDKLIRKLVKEIDQIKPEIDELKNIIVKLKNKVHETKGTLSAPDQKKYDDAVAKYEAMTAQLEKKNNALFQHRLKPVDLSERKKVTVLKIAKAKNLTEQDIADYEVRKKRCPQLPKVEFVKQQ